MQQDELVIYRRCYKCNINVPYQVSIIQSFYGPCQFCREEETPLNVQSRSRKTARDVTELTTYRRDRNSSSDDTRSLPSNMVTRSYKFQIGSSQNVSRRTRGGGRRPLQSAQGTAKVSASAATSSTVNSTGQRSTYQVYCSVCRRHVAEN